jgi:hypothetical protein
MKLEWGGTIMKGILAAAPVAAFLSGWFLSGCSVGSVDYTTDVSGRQLQQELGE